MHRVGRAGWYSRYVKNPGCEVIRTLDLGFYTTRTWVEVVHRVDGRDGVLGFAWMLTDRN